VCFDQLEEYVVAGSSGGVVKLWDLDAQKGIEYIQSYGSMVTLCSCSFIEWP
jgi:hypothetical protein